MEAPNKIYLSVIPDSPGQYNGIYEEWSLAPIGGAENIEYIRKDALLEWAESKMKEYALKSFEKNGDATHWGQRNAFQQVIDKINSL